MQTCIIYQQGCVFKSFDTKEAFISDSLMAFDMNASFVSKIFYKSPFNWNVSTGNGERTITCLDLLGSIICVKKLR